MEPGEYILKLNHALDEASKDYLVGITPYLIQEGCRKVISKSLASRSSSFGPVVLQQIREIQTEMKAVGFPVSSLELVPLVEVVTSFSRKAGILYKKGINFMEDPDPSLVSDLSEFLIDPLSDRTWRVDRSLKKARAFGRFGTAVRTASVKALRSFEVGISEDREVIYLVMPGRTSIPAPIGHRDMILSGGLPPLRIVKAYRRKGMTLDDI